MIYLCAHCRHGFRPKDRQGYLCQLCHEYISAKRIKLPEKYGIRKGARLAPLYSAFPYGPSIRKLVLGAKVSGEQGAIEACWQLLSQSPSLDNYLDGVVEVMPAPSSLWSRLRGRVDLAAALAQRIARRYQIPCNYFSRAAYLRGRKRAKLASRDRLQKGCYLERSCAKLESRSPSGATILLVDDVVTSGYTLASLLDTKTEPIRALSLARASR